MMIDGKADKKIFHATFSKPGKPFADQKSYSAVREEIYF